MLRRLFYTGHLKIIYNILLGKHLYACSLFINTLLLHNTMNTNCLTHLNYVKYQQQPCLESQNVKNGVNSKLIQEYVLEGIYIKY